MYLLIVQRYKWESLSAMSLTGKALICSVVIVGYGRGRDLVGRLDRPNLARVKGELVPFVGWNGPALTCQGGST